MRWRPARLTLSALALFSLAPSGETSPPDPPPPGANGWIEEAGGVAPPGSWIARMSATFPVPSTPPRRGQVLYFFPGLEPADQSVILQPVLELEDGQWWLRSWRVGDLDPVQRSARVHTSSGDTIRGTMESSECSEGGVCTWTVTATDVTTGQSAVLTEQESSVVYARFFSGVLEAYYLGSCEQYPKDGGVTFEGIRVHDNHGAELPTSTFSVEPTKPRCSFRVRALQSDAVGLEYGADEWAQESLAPAAGATPSWVAGAFGDAAFVGRAPFDPDLTTMHIDGRSVRVPSHGEHFPLVLGSHVVEVQSLARGFPFSFVQQFEVRAGATTTVRIGSAAAAASKVAGEGSWGPGTG